MAGRFIPLLWLQVSSSGGEIAAIVAEQGFADLKARIVRVAPRHTPIPFSLPLEKLFIPDEAAIADAVRSVLAYH